MSKIQIFHHGDTAKKREKQKQKALPCFSPCRRVAVVKAFRDFPG
jgi:hypothetical protein